MFELTDTLTYAVPVMLSVLVAKTVADALEPKGIYDLVIEYVALRVVVLTTQISFLPSLSQLPYLDSKHVYLWGENTVSDVVSFCTLAVPIGRTVNQLLILSPSLDRP